MGDDLANALSDAEPVTVPDDFDESDLNSEFDSEVEAATNEWDSYQSEIEQSNAADNDLFDDLVPDSLPINNNLNNTEQKTNAQNDLESKISNEVMQQDTFSTGALKSTSAQSVETPLDNYQGEKIVGQSSRIRSEDGQWHEVDYEVLDAARLNPTIEQADNQYRDRNRAALTQQVQSIGNDLQYELVGQSPVMDYGAPVLNQSGQIVAGNGRMSGIQEAYKAGKGGTYKAKLVEDAGRLGINPARVQGMKYPVLVRRFKNAVNTREMAVMSNEGGAARMSPLEQARVDAERVVSLHDLVFDDAGNITLPAARNLVRRILAKMPINQHNELMDADGGISQSGMRRIQNAVLHLAYGDSPALQRLVERTDNTSRNVLNALNGAAPALADLRDNVKQGIAHPHLDIVPHLIDAVEIFTRLRSQGINVQEWLNQLDAFNETPIEIKQLLNFLDKKARKPATLRDFLQRYAEGVKQAGNPKQVGLFGDNPPTSNEVINNAITQANTSETERNTSSNAEPTRTGPSQDQGINTATTKQSSVAEGATASESWQLKDRLARAKDLGFDTSTIYFHGTYSDIKGFSKSKISSQSRGLIYFTSDPEYANTYAQDGGNGYSRLSIVENVVGLNIARESYPNSVGNDLYIKNLSNPEEIRNYFYDSNIGEIEALEKIDDIAEAVRQYHEIVDSYTEGGNVIPVYLKKGKTYQKENGEGIAWQELEKLGGATWLKSNGYDSAIVNENNGNQVVAVTDPSQVRSIFAEFAPDKQQENDLLFSKTKSNTKQQNYKAALPKVRNELINKLGSGTFNKLVQSGRLVISDNAPPNVAGVYDNGVVTLYPQNIPVGQAWSVFVHEAGEHAALSTMLGNEYADLVKQFNQLLEKGNPEAIKAAERVPASTPAEHIDSERLAYLAQGVIESGKLNTVGSRVIAAVRRFIQKVLRKLGIESAINPKDIASLIEKAAKAWARGEVQSAALSVSAAPQYSMYSMLDTLSDPAKAKALLRRGFAGAERSIKKSWSEKNPSDLVLHTMTLQTIIDRNKQIFNKFAENPLTAIERHNQGMLAVMQHWANRFEKSHDAFMRLSAPERQGVMDMMLNATLNNAHPDQEYVPSLNIKWAKDKQKQLQNELKAIEVDERKARHNQTQTPEQRIRATKKAQAGLALLQKKMDFEAKRFKAYPDLAKQWHALSNDQQAVYQDWKKQLNALWEKQTQALEQHIADIVRENKLDPNAAQAALDTVKGLRLQYRKQLQLGPYFPLKRYGDYVVQVRSLGEYARYHFESEFEANEFAASIKKDEPKAQILVSKKVELLNQPKDAPGVVGKLLSALNDVQGLSDEQKRTLNAFVLDQLPDLSARKAEMRRHFVAGASGDMERGFANAMLHGGHDLGRILFGHKIQRAMSHTAEQIKLPEGLVAGKYDDKPLAKDAAEQSILIDEADRVQAGRVLNVMRKQIDAMMSPNTNAAAAFMSNAAFFMLLAGSPAAGLLNLMQIAQITYPALAARFGDVKANNELFKAATDVMRATKLGRTADGKFDIRQGIFSTSSAQHLTQEERYLLETFELEGVTSTTQASALARTASGDGLANVGKFALKMSKASAYLGFFFHNAEIFNRQVTQLAAYRLYQSVDKNTQQKMDKLGSNGAGAVDFARWITTRTHYNYGHANRALMIKGNAAKILLPMKNYSIMTTEFLLTRMKDVISKETDPEVKKLAARELLRVMGTTALLAGAAGVGGAWMGTAALSTAVGYKFGGKAAGTTALFLIAAMVLAPLMGDPDEPFDPGAIWTQFLREYLGDFGEQAINRGVVNATTGIDLSSRIGINSLLYREASINNDQGGAWVNQLAEQLLGANYSLVKSMADGADLMSQGEIQKGMEKWLPKFLRDISKTQRYATEGLTGRKGEELLGADEFNAWELANQAMGFAPDDVTQVYDDRNIIETAKVQLERRRNGLVNRYKRAVLDGKGDLKEIQSEINRWNGKNPYLSISPEDLKRTIKTTEKNRANKAEHSGVLISKKYQQQLEALGYK